VLNECAVVREVPGDEELCLLQEALGSSPTVREGVFLVQLVDEAAERRNVYR